MLLVLTQRLSGGYDGALPEYLFICVKSSHLQAEMIINLFRSILLHVQGAPVFEKSFVRCVCVFGCVTRNNRSDSVLTSFGVLHVQACVWDILFHFSPQHVCSSSAVVDCFEGSRFLSSKN